MENVTSTTWRKLMEIPCDTSNTASIVSAIRDYTDFLNDVEDEDIIRDYINGEWGDVCSDGIILWED